MTEDKIIAITFFIVLAEFIGFIFKGKFFWDAFFRGAFAIIVILLIAAIIFKAKTGSIHYYN